MKALNLALSLIGAAALGVGAAMCTESLHPRLAVIAIVSGVLLLIEGRIR